MLYTGSLTNTAEYKSCGDMKSYVSSMVSMGVVPGDDVMSRRDDESVMAAFQRIMSSVFDFSLLKTLAFLPILAAGFLCFFGRQRTRSAVFSPHVVKLRGGKNSTSVEYCV